MEKLLGVKDQKVLLDTNILIQATKAKTKEQRGCLMTFCGQNTTYICDTVYYEFLRHSNIRHFREKRAVIADWPKVDPMTDNQVLREDESVRKIFECLWTVYLYEMRKEPKRIIHVNTEDLWIASAAVHYKIDRILTTDHSGDFAPELFDDQSFDLGENLTVHLKTFRREQARKWWDEIQKTGEIRVECNSIGK